MIYGLVTLAAPWAGGKMNNWSLLNNKPIINGSKRVLTFTIMSVIGGVGWGGVGWGGCICCAAWKSKWEFT
jgi:hypothetical protein